MMPAGERPAPIGALQTSARNARYFSDPSGRVIVLTGSHAWDSLQAERSTEQGRRFDWSRYLELLRSHNHNFVRLWAWESTTELKEGHGPRTLMPYRRRGPEAALDGLPKFDLDEPDDEYYRLLRSRVDEAGRSGIYVSVMLFQGWSVKRKSPTHADPWPGHPFNVANNVNGVDGDPYRVGDGRRVHQIDGHPQLRRIGALQRLHVERVVDRLYDLPNVLYEIANECEGSATAWQHEMIEHVKSLERSLGVHHPVGMTFAFDRQLCGTNEELFQGSADWISPSYEPDYLLNVPIADGAKVSLLDSDHLWGVGGGGDWVWRAFTRGHNPIYMDPFNYLDEYAAQLSEIEDARSALGEIQELAAELDLATLEPDAAAASTGCCLACRGVEYLVFKPASERTVRMRAEPGTYAVRWWSRRRKAWWAPAAEQILSSSEELAPPFEGEALLHMGRARPAIGRGEH